jgi:hypothetical protein
MQSQKMQNVGQLEMERSGALFASSELQQSNWFDIRVQICKSSLMHWLPPIYKLVC